MFLNGARYPRMGQVKFVEDSLPFTERKKGRHPQILTGPFLNTLSQI